MKFHSVLALQSFLVSLTLAAATSFASYAKPKGTVDTIQTQLAYTNGSAYFGDVKYSSDSEALILTYPRGAPGPTTGGVSWTSFHSAQTGWQNMYIFPNDVKPIGFTTPHSAFIPPGADVYNFTVSETDKLLRYKNTNRWYACNSATPTGTYQIFYVGEGKHVPARCIKTDIITYGYGDCPS